MGRQAVIVGAADAPLENGVLKDGGTVLQVQARTAKAALDEAGLNLAEVDGLLTAGLWGVPGPGSLMSITLGEYLGIRPRFTDATNIGGSAFEAHLAHAAMAIEKGYCEVALISYGSTQRSDRSRNLAGRPPTLTMQYESPFGMLMPVGGYALSAMRHMHDYGTTSEQLAEIAVAARQWASLNPMATHRTPITVDDVLASPMISAPLHQLDCCLVSDGAAAVVVTTEERARSLPTKPIYVRGYGESHTHWTISQMPDLTTTTASETGRRAMNMAGVRHDDIDVLQIYDSFTITTLLTLEALGFCRRGEGGEFVSEGRLGPGGERPINTNGGGLSCAHPGMYGLLLMVEAIRQLRGECGERQLPNPTVALVNGTGGTLSSTATCVLATH
ncbi:acetyl-CoA acetyltransferase [Alloalcanivorax xenomutans]|uniref:acetyl-CoA acetyltransferase n=1 Tax=Alloalcanivorax xenomutans TaxID=1094342 RepID=UPI0009B62CCB|nr:acetyl-CoA acetyltransferase [Alloalcanivorax xenomutans]MCE7522034.1 acetyl-CoA acetyltransferase [Alloalcanivorax xenomutans]